MTDCAISIKYTGVTRQTDRRIYRQSICGAIYTHVSRGKRNAETALTYVHAYAYIYLTHKGRLATYSARHSKVNQITKYNIRQTDSRFPGQPG